MAFHETVAHNYRQKINTARDLPSGELLGYLREVLSRQLEDAVLLPGEHPLELLELPEVMLTKYLNEAAPPIQPAAVETKVAGTIGGVRVYGYVDLLTSQVRVDFPPMAGIGRHHELALAEAEQVVLAHDAGNALM